jgi:hypothetical protein
MFATVGLTTDGRIALRTWRVVPLKGIVALDSLIHTNTTGPLAEIDVARSSVQSMLRFVTASRPTAGLGFAQSWDVDATTGEIGLVDSLSIWRTSGMSLTPVPEIDPADLFPEARFALVGKRDGGLAAFELGVDWDGQFTVGPFPTQLGGGYSQVDATGFGANGLVAAVRMNDGTAKLIVWELQATASGSANPVRIASHQTTVSGTEIEICRTPASLSEGDVITAYREGSSGSLRIRGWRIGDRPFAIPTGAAEGAG